MAATGRPTILTQELTNQLCQHISAGTPKVRACWLVGIPEQYLYLWEGKGKTDLEEGKETVYSIFYESVKKAEAILTELIRDGMMTKPDWQRWARIGEALQPNEWSRAERMSVDMTFDGRAGAVMLPEKR